MDLNLIKNDLLDKPYLSGIKINNNESYKNQSYDVKIKCELKVGSSWFPIIIGIPNDWGQNLVDIYIALAEIPYIPHIDNKGKLCLYDLEGSIIEKDLLGILNQCILRAQLIIEEGISKENWNDFLEEFDSYILHLPRCKGAKVVIPDSESSKKIFYCPTKEIKKERRKNEPYSQYLRRTETNYYFASLDTKDFKEWGYKSPIKNGLYLYSEAVDIIYPPRIDKPISVEYLNVIFQNVRITSDVAKITRKAKEELFIIFEIKQPNGIYNSFGVIIKAPCFNMDSTLELIEKTEIIPLYVERLDERSLLNRTSFDENILSNKEYLLIGCGSIGGYVFSNLIKSGCKNITLIDHDKLESENIYRHLLGRDYIGDYKVEALRKFGERSLPGLKIKTVAEKIQDAIDDSGIDFNDYDYVIAATGNSILNMWINDYIITNKINTPVFYIWNETLDIGSHVAVIQFDKAGCYECIFKRDEVLGLYDSTSYCKPGQNVTKNVSGCSGTFIPYGSLISIQSSILFIDLLKKFTEGRIVKNIIVSEKGDDYYFKKAGFILSDNYNNQEDKISTIKGSDFKNTSCNICGGK
jgi:molybdopterin/thiamine biosynthesis adenylyltransferase